MSLYGFEVPCGKNTLATAKRKRIFDIIAPYVMSQDDLELVAERPVMIRDLWLESLANTHRTMLLSKLQRNTKDFLRKFFPSGGSCPSRKLALLVGLRSDASILDR